MTSLILSTICAVALNAAPLSAPADTIIAYAIDGQKIEHFDGSQLVGKKIAAYEILKLDAMEGPTILHSILTEEGANKSDLVVINGEKYEGDASFKLNGAITIRSVDPSFLVDDIVYVLDGKIITADDFKKLDPRGIESITVLKDAPAEPVLQNLRDQGKYQGSVNPAGGVIVVTTKKGSK